MSSFISSSPFVCKPNTTSRINTYIQKTAPNDPDTINSIIPSVSGFNTLILVLCSFAGDIKSPANVNQILSDSVSYSIPYGWGLLFGVGRFHSVIVLLVKSNFAILFDPYSVKYTSSPEGFAAVNLGLLLGRKVPFCYIN